MNLLLLTQEQLLMLEVDTYKDITTDGLTIDSLYTCYSTTDKAFPVGSPIVKLDIDK